MQTIPYRKRPVAPIPAADQLAQMERALINRRQPTQPTSPNKLVPLASETRSAITTAEAAAHLGRQPQTLRGWACHDDGPIRPIRVNGRLAWPVAGIKAVLGVATK